MKRWSQIVASLVFLLIAAGLIAGCGSGAVAANSATPTPTATASPSPTPTISPSPSPSPTPSATPSPSPSPTPTVTTRFAFEATGDVTVQGYSVNASTGVMTALPQGPVNIGQGFSQWVAADRAGRFLFVSSPSDNVHGFKIGQDNIAAFVIDKNTGNLTNAPGSPIVLAGSAGGIAVTPDGKFLYMAGFSGIFVYKINQTTAELTEIPGSPFATAGFLESEEIAISHDGKFLFVDESDLGVFSLDDTSGVPTEITGSPFQIGPSFFATPIFADPLGRFLFVGGFLDNGPNVAVEQVAANGALTPAPGSPFLSGAQSTFVITDPQGRFLYVADNVSDVIRAFTVDASTGSLTPIAGSPFSLGPNVSANIGGFATDAAGKFLFAGNGGTPMVFSIDPVTGALTPSASNAGGSPFENQLVTVAY